MDYVLGALTSLITLTTFSPSYSSESQYAAAKTAANAPETKKQKIDQKKVEKDAIGAQCDKENKKREDFCRKLEKEQKKYDLAQKAKNTGKSAKAQPYIDSESAKRAGKGVPEKEMRHKSGKIGEENGRNGTLFLAKAAPGEKPRVQSEYCEVKDGKYTGKLDPKFKEEAMEFVGLRDAKEKGKKETYTRKFCMDDNRIEKQFPGCGACKNGVAQWDRSMGEPKGITSCSSASQGSGGEKGTGFTNSGAGGVIPVCREELEEKKQKEAFQKSYKYEEPSKEQQDLWGKTSEELKKEADAIKNAPPDATAEEQKKLDQKLAEIKKEQDWRALAQLPKSETIEKSGGANGQEKMDERVGAFSKKDAEELAKERTDAQSRGGVSNSDDLSLEEARGFTVKKRQDLATQYKNDATKIINTLRNEGRQKSDDEIYQLGKQQGELISRLDTLDSAVNIENKDYTQIMNMDLRNLGSIPTFVRSLGETKTNSWYRGIKCGALGKQWCQ